MNEVDIALCELRLVEKEGGGWRPAHIDLNPQPFYTKFLNKRKKRNKRK